MARRGGGGDREKRERRRMTERVTERETGGEKERKSRNDPGVAVALSTGPLVGIKPGVGAVAVPASSSAGPFSTSTTTIIATTTTTITTTSGKSSSTSIATSAEVARLLALGASVKPGTDSRSRTRRVRVVLGVLLPVRIWSARRLICQFAYFRSRAVLACRPFARHAVIQCDSTAGREGIFGRDVESERLVNTSVITRFDKPPSNGLDRVASLSNVTSLSRTLLTRDAKRIGWIEALRAGACGVGAIELYGLIESFSIERILNKFRNGLCDTRRRR